MFLSNPNPTTSHSKLPAAFHAVIFVDDPIDQPTLTSLTRAKPLSLLSIANRPLLHYLLSWLEEGGVKEATLVISPSANLQVGAQLAYYLHKVYEGTVRVNLHPLEAAIGSAQVLVKLKARLQCHILVLNSDFLSSAPLKVLLQKHRLHLPALTAYFYEPSKPDPVAPSSKDSEKPPTIGLEPTRSQWIYSSKTNSEEELKLRMSLLHSFPRVQLHRTLFDSGVYVLSSWVVDFLSSMPSIHSVQKDLVPLLVKMQSRPGLPAWEQLSNVISTTTVTSDPLTRQYSTLPNTASWHTVDLNHSNSMSAALALPPAADRPNLVCLATVERQGILGRLNSLSAYHDLNRQFAKSYSAEDRIHESVEKENSAQVGPDSLVGKSSKLSERSSIKKSVIGDHCQIGKNVKIINSVLMDHVVIEDGVKLENCVIGSQAIIQERAQLKDVEVGDGVTIAKDKQLKTTAVWD